MPPRILVIIVTYNGEKWVKNVSDGINNSSIKLDTIIIDNKSSDNTINMYKKYLNNIVEIVENEKNLGFGGANNVGLKYAIDHDYDYVYLLNQDARFFGDTIEKLINISKSHIEAGIISPFQCGCGLKKIDKNFQINVCSFDSNNDIFSDLYFGTERELYEVSGVMAAHRLLPVKVIKKVGGFSPTFFHYGEDDNYINRVKYFGFKVYISPNINVVHDRYERKDTTDRIIYLLYTSFLNVLSDPCLKNNRTSYFKMFAYSFYYSLIYKSFKPIINFFKVIIDYPMIHKNKIKSISTECPFLR